MLKKTLIRVFMLLSVVTALLCARILALFSRRQENAKFTILVVRLDQTLGDSSMNSPLLRELRQAYPHAEIRLVVHPRIYDMVRHCPHVDHIYRYDWGSSLAKSLLFRHWLSWKFCWTHFRQQQPDLALVPRFDEDHHAGFIALLSGAPRRIAYIEKATQRKQLLNAGFDMLYTEVLPADGLKHEVERNLDFVRHLGFEPASTELEFWSTAEETAYAQEFLAEHKQKHPDGLLIGLGLSGGYSILKRWPLHYYVELATLLQQQYHGRHVTFLLVGGKEDIPLGAEFEEKLQGTVLNMIAKTSIAQMAALLQHCHQFIGNDSGAMHVAASAGIAVTGIFGSSCHHRFSAWGKSCDTVTLELECGPCGQGHIIDRCSTCIYPSPKCMDDLAPAQVLKKISIVQNYLR